jgi:uncharacterized membrane protein
MAPFLAIYSHLNLYVLCLAAITTLSAVLSLIFLGEKSFWDDEAISTAIARSDWSNFWRIIFLYEVNMSLYHVLLKLWINFGQNEFVIRSLSVVFSVLTIPVMYALGSLLFNKRAGLLAALLMAINVFFIRYAQEARGYSLLLLLTTLSTYFFVFALHKSSKWIWAAYVVFSVFAMYTHVFALFVIATQATSLLLLKIKDIPFKGLIISWIGIGLLVLPLAVYYVTQNPTNLDWAEPPGRRMFLYLFMQLTGGNLLMGLTGGRIFWGFGAAQYFALAVYFVLCLVTLVHAVKIWFVKRTSYETWHYGMILLYLFLPITIVWFISQVKPMFTFRYFIICLTPLMLLSAFGISHIARKWLFIVSLMLVLVVSAFGLNTWYTKIQKTDFKGATAYVLSMSEEADAVIFFAPTIRTGFEYYKDKTQLPGNIPAAEPYYDPDVYDTIPFIYIPEGFGIGGSQPEPDVNLPDRLSKYSHIWLLLSFVDSALETTQQSEDIETSLKSRFELTDERKLAGIRVFRFTNTEYPK